MYNDLYADVYNFHKKWAQVTPKDDAYWKSVCDEANALGQKYKSSSFAIDLLASVTKELGRVSAANDGQQKCA